MLVILIPFQHCSEMRNFEASPHLIKHLLLLWSQVHIKENPCTGLCVTAQCFSQYTGPINETADFEVGNLWNEEQMKSLHHSTCHCAASHPLSLISDMIPFFVSLFFSFHVLLSCFSLWTLERLYSFYIFNQGQQSHCKLSCLISLGDS